MQAVAYEGYFEKERFYTSSGAMRLPEGKRVIVTIFEESKAVNVDSQNIDVQSKKRNIGFLDGSPLPDCFFEPLPEEELELWSL